jgi:hypothetical protein
MTLFVRVRLCDITGSANLITEPSRWPNGSPEHRSERFGWRACEYRAEPKRVSLAHLKSRDPSIRSAKTIAPSRPPNEDAQALRLGRPLLTGRRFAFALALLK